MEGLLRHEVQGGKMLDAFSSDIERAGLAEVGKTGQRQLTAVLGVTMTGEYLPPQLIY